MALLLTSQQCFFIAIVAFGVIGFFRGGLRELVSLVFALAVVLFLLFNGGNALAQFFLVKTPVAFQYFFGSGNPQKPAAPSPNDVLAVTLIAFALIVVLGYFIGNRVFPTKGNSLTPAGRFFGILLGLGTGLVLILYISNVFAKSSLISLNIGTPTQSLLSNSAPVLFVAFVVALIAGLIAVRVKKSSTPAKKP